MYACLLTLSSAQHRASPLDASLTRPSRTQLLPTSRADGRTVERDECGRSDGRKCSPSTFPSSVAAERCSSHIGAVTGSSFFRRVPNECIRCAKRLKSIAPAPARPTCAHQHRKPGKQGIFSAVGGRWCLRRRAHWRRRGCGCGCGCGCWHEQCAKCKCECRQHCSCEPARSCRC